MLLQQRWQLRGTNYFPPNSITKCFIPSMHNYHRLQKHWHSEDCVCVCTINTQIKKTKQKKDFVQKDVEKHETNRNIHKGSSAGSTGVAASKGCIFSIKPVV